jgi:RNA polymerase sigma-70 factor (ECF subfamily)
MVVKNECFMILRKTSKETSVEYIEKYEQESTDDIELKNSLEINLQLIEQKLTLLKEEQRICIQLFYIEEKSYTQISEQLNFPITKVKSAIQNGKRNIKLLLEEENEFSKK